MDFSQKQRRNDTLIMLVTALMWSMGGILVKSVPWNPLAIAGVRSVVAAAVIALYMAARRMRVTVNKKSLSIMASLVCVYIPFIAATKLTTAANAIVIQFSAPLFVLLFNAIVGKQRLRLPDVLAVLLTTLGVAVCFMDDLGGGSLAGDVIALISGLGFAAVLLCSGGATDGERVNGLLQGQALTALIGLPFFFAGGYTLAAPASWYLLALGVLQLGVPYILYTVAARSCPPLACALLSSLEPLLNPVWVALFNGETPGVLTLIGGVLVIASVTGWCVLDGRRAKAQGEVA